MKAPKYLALWSNDIWVVVDFDKSNARVNLKHLKTSERARPLTESVVVYKIRANYA